MLVYRITWQKYANDLSGYGAKRYGGRWNSIGVPLLYTSSSVSLAVLENLVHLQKHLLPKDIVLITLEVDENLPNEIKSMNNLPKNWRKFPVPVSSQKIGDSMVKENQKLYLTVPSTLVVNEMNILINVLHWDFNKVKIVETKPFTLDVRLFM